MPERMTLYYKDGSTSDMDSVDARRALRDHPSEWSASPFPKDYVETQSKKVQDEQASAEAKRRADEAEAQRIADERAARERAEQDAESARIQQQQEEKRKADEAARNNGLSGQSASQPVTNDGLKVGHIPSEVPALEAGYLAKHRGAGSYSVLDANGNEVLEKMSKEDAEAFNALTAAEKAEWVKSETDKKS